MNKLYWMDTKGHVMEAVVHMSQTDFQDAVRELIDRSTEQLRQE